MKEASVIILAAGNSERMGKDKAQLPFDHDFSFMDQLIGEYLKAGLKNIIIISQQKKISSKHHKHNKVNWVQNLAPEKGRAWSIYLALRYVDPYLPFFIQNVDNPFTDHSLIQLMLDTFCPGHIVFPLYQQKKGHPILLPYQFVNQLPDKDLNSFDFRESLQNFPSKGVPWEDERILSNINTVKDYHRWFGKKF